MILNVELLISLALLDYFCLGEPLSSFFLSPLHLLTQAFYRQLPRLTHSLGTIHNISFFSNTNLFPSVQMMSTWSFLSFQYNGQNVLLFFPTIHLLQWLFMTDPELKKIRCNPHKLPDLLCRPRHHEVRSGCVCEATEPNLGNFSMPNFDDMLERWTHIPIPSLALSL